MDRATRRRELRRFLDDARRRGPVVQLDCGCYRLTCPDCRRPLAAVLNPRTGEWRCDGGGEAELAAPSAVGVN